MPSQRLFRLLLYPPCFTSFLPPIFYHGRGKGTRRIREVAVYSGGADACLLTRRAVTIRSSAGALPMRVQDAVTRKLIRILEETRYKKR